MQTVNFNLIVSNINLICLILSQLSSNVSTDLIWVTSGKPVDQLKSLIYYHIHFQSTCCETDIDIIMKPYCVSYYILHLIQTWNGPPSVAIWSTLVFILFKEENKQSVLCCQVQNE